MCMHRVDSEIIAHIPSECVLKLLGMGKASSTGMTLMLTTSGSITPLVTEVMLHCNMLSVTQII